MSRWQVVLTDPYGASNPVAIEVTGGRFSWAVNDTGVANVECWTTDLKANGLLPARDNLAGRGLRWAHGPYLWRGVVTAPRSRGAGVTELVAKDLSCRLVARHTPKVADTGMANPGAILRRAVEDRYRASDPIGLAIETAEVGPSLPSAQRSADLMGLLRTLQQAAGWEWTIDHATAALRFAPRVGRDKSASVVLTEGANILDFADTFDLEAVVNELMGVPATAPYERTRTVRVRDEASISRHGLRQATEVFRGLVTRPGLRSVAEARLRALVGAGDTLAITLDGGDPLAGEFAVGDDLLVVLPSVNARYKARVMVMVYDLDADRLDLSLETMEALA